ncbi:MAG: TonB-dependent receptor [Gemmatimonadales bacterium]|nr:TonB-dependent receptor [Gemmatimonadales bacterium]
MRPTSVRTVFSRTAAASLFLVAAAMPLHAQGTTTATFRGRVTGSDGTPVSATVTVINGETGVVRRTVAAENGRYAMLGLQVGGPYAVRAQAIGYRPQEKTGYRLGLTDVVAVDFTLESVPVEVSEVTVTADVVPVVDAQQPGRVDRVGLEQIQSLPTNGRNFSDFIALSPQVNTAVGDGSGGNLSIGGGRRGANNILIDGVGANGTFFGGEARGSDRIPFAYSIEAVREFQVETNAYDVTRGNYTGGLVNAVTKSGGNQFRGAVWGYRRSADFTKRDFLGRDPVDFTSNQFGFSLSGPIIRDRLHFFLTVDRQDRDQPVFATDVSSDSIARNTGIHPDSLARLLSILQNTYGYATAGEQGKLIQTQDETSVFARVDWQLSNRHQLAVRYNFTDLVQHNDRVATRDLRGAGGDFLNKGKSFVASLTSSFSNSLFNELRVQRATEPRPRPGYSQFPQIRTTVASGFQNADGSITPTSATIVAGGDPILHFNDLDERTWEIQDNLTWVRGSHTVRVGTTNSFIHVFNFFGNNALGTFSFRSLADLENRAPDSFTRALPADTNSALSVEARFPKAEYDVREWAFYAQDQWQVTPRLNLVFGVRYDLATFPDAPAPNPAFQRSFPDLDVSRAPRDRNNIAPRFGFTYDMSGNRTTIVRGGAGLFYGRSPYVLFSNVFLNTGNTQLSLSCFSSAGNVPEPNLATYAANPDSIPTQCVGGGAASAGTPNVNVFSRQYETPRSFKTNFGIDHAVDRDTRVGLDLSYSHIGDNFFVIDRNLATVPQFFTEGGRPVYSPLVAIGSTGSINRNFNRVDAAFGQVLEHVSTAEAENISFTVSASRRLTRGLQFQASYTYSRTEDNASYSCCISSTALFETPTGGNPNDLRGNRSPADFDRPHTLILSGIARLPWGIQLSGIFRGFSGLPYTPRINGDPNGDGISSNDRAYVGTNILYNFDANSDVDSTTQKNNQRTILEDLIQGNSCLRAALNTVVRRNACRNPWINQLDLRLSKRFQTMRGQSVELVADFFNFLNFLNSEWGRVWTVAGAGGGSNGDLLSVRGFNSAQSRFVYDVNPSFGTKEPSAFRFDQFQAQFGLRYNF